jgi:hypothetical protein
MPAYPFIEYGLFIFQSWLQKGRKNMERNKDRQTRKRWRGIKKINEIVSNTSSTSRSRGAELCGRRVA